MVSAVTGQDSLAHTHIFSLPVQTGTCRSAGAYRGEKEPLFHIVLKLDTSTCVPEWTCHQRVIKIPRKVSFKALNTSLRNHGFNQLLVIKSFLRFTLFGKPLCVVVVVVGTQTDS